MLAFQQKHTKRVPYVRHQVQSCGGFKDASKASPTSRLEKTRSSVHLLIFPSPVYRENCPVLGSMLASGKLSCKILQS